MDAILTIPITLASELRTLRSEIECHRQAIELDSQAFMLAQVARSSLAEDISRRMAELRLKLAT